MSVVHVHPDVEASAPTSGQFPECDHPQDLSVIRRRSVVLHAGFVLHRKNDEQCAQGVARLDPAVKPGDGLEHAANAKGRILGPGEEHLSVAEMVHEVAVDQVREEEGVLFSDGAILRPGVAKEIFVRHGGRKSG